MARQLADALQTAGIAPAAASVCAVHHELKPCKTCDDVFNRAEALKRQQNQARAKRIHSEYLAKRSRKAKA